MFSLPLSRLPPKPPLLVLACCSLPKWLGGGSAVAPNEEVVRFGGGDLGAGEREVERRGGGERAREVSGAVSWYGAKSMIYCGQVFGDSEY